MKHLNLVRPRYEEGHGLVDAVRFQKKLKNDLYRLESELEERSLKARTALCLQRQHKK